MSMNIIWKVKRSRSFVRMLTDYFAMMIICPFIFAIASSSIVYVTTMLHTVAEEHELLQKASPYFFMFYRTLALVMSWLLFAALYIIMPNKKVGWKYGMIAGVLAGTTYYFMQEVMITFQIGVSQYNAIYGSFAALPIFLLWLQINWVTVLMGGEIAYHMEHLAPSLSRSQHTLTVTKNHFAVLLLLRIVERFRAGEEPKTDSELSKELGVTSALTEDLLADLSKAALISEVRSNKSGCIYQPATDTKNITLQSVILAIDKNTQEMIDVNASDDAISIQTAMKVFETAKDDSPANALLEDLIS